MKDKQQFDWYTFWVVTVVLVIVGGIAFTLGNTIYCHVRYWNTPYTQIPYHCPIMNNSK